MPGTPEYEARQAREQHLRGQEKALQAAKRERDREAKAAEEQLRRESEAADARARTEGRFISDWASAERAVSWAMRETLGCTEVTLTNAGADGGVDVESAEMSAQVKHQAKPIGRPVVQQIKGAAGERIPAVFGTWSGNPNEVFARTATEWADGNGVALFAINSRGVLKGMSVRARRLLDGEAMTAAAGAVLPFNASAAARELASKRRKAGSECPACGGVLMKRTNSKTRQRFLGCSNWPVCRRTYSLP